MAMAGRVKAGMLRLGDLSLLAIAVGCGYVGYNRNASEDPAAKQQRIRREQSLAHRRRVEDAFFQLAKQYDLKADELMKKRDEVYKIREETQTLSTKVLQHSVEVGRDIEKLQKLLKVREDLRQQASSVRQQKRTLNAEVEELSKLVKIKEDLQARSKKTTDSPPLTGNDELQILSLKVQERSRMLEAEIEELMRLVKVKEELQAKAEALDEPVITHLGDQLLKKDDSV
ncbi:hypothetical protein L7F22_050040 [Adiantum nelumboides]|nr:hypothetical protein [Adiantum nelumboides]